MQVTVKACGPIFQIFQTIFFFSYYLSFEEVFSFIYTHPLLVLVMIFVKSATVLLEKSLQTGGQTNWWSGKLR
jgi:hypothetical protein